MKRLAFAILLLPSLALAQPAPEPTRADYHSQATTLTLAEFMQGYLAVRADLLAAQARIAKLEARIAELEAKPKP